MDIVAIGHHEVSVFTTVILSLARASYWDYPAFFFIGNGVDFNQDGEDDIVLSGLVDEKGVVYTFYEQGWALFNISNH